MNSFRVILKEDGCVHFLKQNESEFHSLLKSATDTSQDVLNLTTCFKMTDELKRGQVRGFVWNNSVYLVEAGFTFGARRTEPNEIIRLKTVGPLVIFHRRQLGTQKVGSIEEKDESEHDIIVLQPEMDYVIPCSTQFVLQCPKDSLFQMQRCTDITEGLKNLHLKEEIQIETLDFDDMLKMYGEF